MGGVHPARAEGLLNQTARAASPGQASASVRRRAKSTGRRARLTTRSPRRAARRQPSTTAGPERPAPRRPRPASRGRACPDPIRRAAGSTSVRPACSTSASSAPIPRPGRRLPRRQQRHPGRPCPSSTEGISKATSAATAARRGGRSPSSVASAPSASSTRPRRSCLRIWRRRAWAAFSRSPCAAKVRSASASARAGEARSRDARAISASAVRQRARPMLSRGPNRRPARRRSSLAFGRSPSWAIAIPRRASAAGSSAGRPA